MTAQTPLYANHLALGASMVDFHGWQLPIHYGSQLAEHRFVRSNAGVFDVSHMTIVDLEGQHSLNFLRYLLANDVANLNDGNALYTCMCNDNGGIIDDLIVYRLNSSCYRLVLNAATKKRDLYWLNQQNNPFDVNILVRDDLAMLAVQGPTALATLSGLFPFVLKLTHFNTMTQDDYFFAYTGYTGEAGLEIIATPEKIIKLWTQLIKAGVQPCGLAARDTLRLEAGLMLYGQDMDESTSPLESALGWTIAWQPEVRNFIGRDALVKQKLQGIKRKMVGLKLVDKAMMRKHQPVILANQQQGIITSGGYSPMLECSIAFARIPITADSEVTVDIRGKLMPAKLTSLRFIQPRRQLCPM